MTSEEVRALEVGQAVRICSDSGEARCVTCTVAFRGGAKFLTYRVKGALIRCEIREYAGWTYSKGGFST